MSERCCVDRLEGAVAVIQRPDESCFEVPISQLAADVQEGDSVYQQDGLWLRDEADTQQRKERLHQLLRQLGQE